MGNTVRRFVSSLVSMREERAAKTVRVKEGSK